MAECKEYVREHPGLDAPLILCARPVFVKGWCMAHDARARHGRPMDGYIRKVGRQGRTCAEHIRENGEPDAALIKCGRPVYGNDLCAAHCKRLREGRAMDRPFKKIDTRRTSGEIKFRDHHGHKKCSNCKQFIPEAEFSRRDGSSDGLQHQCNLCTNLLRYGLNRNKLSTLLERQGFQCANPGCDTAIEVWARASGENRRRPRRSNGISVACVDHDHSCCPGEGSCGNCVRGLLCWYCNAAAGMLSDEPKRLIGLADYISQAPAKGGGD